MELLIYKLFGLQKMVSMFVKMCELSGLTQGGGCVFFCIKLDEKNKG